MEHPYGEGNHHGQCHEQLYHGDGRRTGTQLLKDNCPIEDGALAEDSGDKLSVTYVNSQGVNYPVEIKSAK